MSEKLERVRCHVRRGEGSFGEDAAFRLGSSLAVAFDYSSFSALGVGYFHLTFCWSHAPLFPLWEGGVSISYIFINTTQTFPSKLWFDLNNDSIFIIFNIMIPHVTRFHSIFKYKSPKIWLRFHLKMILIK